MADGTSFLGRAELITFAGFVVPGFIGMLAYSLLQPSYVVKLKEAFLEAIAFGIVNLVILWPLISFLINYDFTVHGFEYWLRYLLGIVVFLVLPVVWAIALHVGLGWLERSNLIVRRPSTAWDAFFLRRLPAKVIVRLKNGSVLGGQIGDRSYASLFPDSGHLYIEKIWKITETGVFTEPIQDSLGVILRPADYEFIELFLPNPNIRDTDNTDVGAPNGADSE